MLLGGLEVGRSQFTSPFVYLHLTTLDTFDVTLKHWSFQITSLLLVLALVSTFSQPFQLSRDSTLLLHFQPTLSSTHDIHLNTLFRINQPNLSRAPIPITLWTSHAPWPGSLQALVHVKHLGGDGHAALEVKALHVRDGLVDPRDGRGVADGALGTVASLELDAVGAPQADLIQV